MVNYSLHGTAENGVDYEKLSGSAVIPPGQRYLTVTVRPIADNLAEQIETVILRLEDPPGKQPPTYRVGHPRRAVALISDFPLLRASAGGQCLSLPDGLLNICFAAETGVNFRVEASSDLRNCDAVAVEPRSNADLNTAAFRIRRFGPTNEELVVNYSLHGTAKMAAITKRLIGGHGGHPKPPGAFLQEPA